MDFVSEEDGLPAIICENCILLLNLSHKFIQSAQETEKNLKNFLTKIETDFQLVTNKTNTSCGIYADDDVNGLLYNFLNGAEITKDDDNSLKNPSSNRTIDSNNEFEGKQEHESDVDELCSLDAIYSTKSLTANNATDDDESRTASDTKKLLTKNVTHYIEETSEELSQIIEYDQLDNTVVVEDESTEQNTVNKGNVINRDIYFEDYETTLGDENSTIGILYEDSSNVFQTNEVQQQLDSPVVIETIVLNADLNIQNDDKIQEENVVTEGVNKKPSRFHLLRKKGSLSSENTRYYCLKCNRDFSTKTNLTRHLQLHEGKRPYQCNICSKNFSQNGTLKQHMYIHTGEKPHVCQVCKRGFTQSKSLVFHMRRHTGEKPHQCDFCSTYFRQKDALKVHIMKYHTDIGDRKYACKICNTEMSGNELRVHMKKHLNNHKITKQNSKTVQMQNNDKKKLNQGEIISQSTKLSSDLDTSTHVVDEMAISTAEPSRAKKYQCIACFKCFAIKKNLLRHLSFHGNPMSSMQKCNTCDLVFDTNYALKVHRVREHKETNINLNECEECQVIFKNSSDLSVHMQYLHSFSGSEKKQLSDHETEEPEETL